ncbi:MAG TPA: S-layer homology domain-containing protein, partial [Chloroflexia bacterium]|nr:S-layer homology domain-containing protein [Chloroflexia bacterium]
EHWNGSAWSVVANPGSGPLYGVAARAANDVWAVGDYYASTYHTVVEHWNGTAWSVVASPSPGIYVNELRGVAALAANDVWAVGDDGDGNTIQTLVEHWNGTAWSVVASPGNGALYGVAAVAANDVWAVGYSSGTLTEHWNGSAWSVVASPNPGTVLNYLNGVAARGANDVWAVGNDYNGSIYRTVVEHWDGTAWSVVASPNLSTSENQLQGVAALGANDVWAVGYYDDTVSVYKTLIEHYTNPCVPPTATPPPCSITFSDVHPTDYFYTPVQYLYCHGVLSGYADGTFRPYTNTTRAQMVKIVVLGFNKPSHTPASGYTFEDVPPTQPFFGYIETAAALNIVSGYTCGQAPAGPCVPPLNRPYFLPYDNVTRGQLSKIDVVAAGWTTLNPPNRTFEDVLPGTAFYSFVETAAARGIISGYTCGSPPAGPCVPPGNRPYFAQQNDATRGQIAKIVYLSILSGP